MSERESRTSSDLAGVPQRLGEFVLGERLGSGGMGVVHRAFQPSLGRDVALKLIRPEHLYFGQARERFRREVEAAARLEHPGIVRVYAAGEDGGVPFCAMERVDGLSLDRLLALLRDREPRALDERTARAAVRDASGPGRPDAGEPRGLRWSELCCRWLCDLALAVDHAHRHGVVHRDLKPSNVMVTADLEVKLLDFGLASTREAVSITRTGSRLGSLPYMAPEQLAGDAAAIDERTDVYALGVTLHEMLTLQSPFFRGGESEERTRQQILDGTAPSIRSLNPAVSWDAETVCAVAMDLDPGRRYRSAADLARDMHNVLERRPIEARRPGAVRRLRRWTQRRPAWAVGIVLGSLLLVIGPTAFAIRERIVRAEIDQARPAVEIELETQGAILGFLNRDLLAAVAPDEVGRSASVRQVLDVAAQRIEGRFPDRPYVEAAVRGTIAKTYMLLGRHDEAEPHLLRAVELFDRHRGPTHEHTLEARRNLASLYRRQDRLTEAESVGREVVDVLVASRGREDQATLIARNNLGLTLIGLGRYDEAEALLTDVVETRLRLLGEEHRHTLASMANLGLMYYKSRRFELAEPWWRRELAGSRKTMDPDHPDLLISLNNWANVQDALGHHAEALAAQEELVARNEAINGPRHPATIRQVINVGTILMKQRDADAEGWFDDALARCRNLPGGHDLVVAARTRLAMLYSRSGRTEEALAMADEILEIHRAAPVPNLERVVSAEHLRIRCLMDARSWSEAEAQCRRTLDGGARGGASDGFVSAIWVMHGQCLEKLERYGEAAASLERGYEMMQALSPRHPRLSVVLDDLVRVHEAWNKPAEADAWREAKRAWQAASSQKQATR